MAKDDDGGHAALLSERCPLPVASVACSSLQPLPPSPTAFHQLLQTAQPQVRYVGRARLAERIGCSSPLKEANS